MINDARKSDLVLNEATFCIICCSYNQPIGLSIWKRTNLTDIASLSLFFWKLMFYQSSYFEGNEIFFFRALLLEAIYLLFIPIFAPV